ncbi:MAG: AAA family ATPase [Candidatus Aminicenantes bacterium]|nr:AAA family ATPase [Candidatus Aminicenantes bacterium]NIM80443.1 AAA family ATPase [Candidatus Aminicenantes bacterium]NIN19836.1 AAA family ATPase [Candidatus Aminicenantes bacterium]NIN43712.1 AAA family ATPase [Candidatus Aminicenantes bacterium]NIN86462.1 AAA family ATPase [Candidatus Aminicenantes bacterium]
MTKPGWLEKKHFNTAGPIDKDDHYYIEPLNRFDLDEILTLIHRKKYFVLHAPRQTGKTSYLLALMKYLNNEGTFKCLYVNVEKAQAARENVRAGIRTILQSMASNAFKYLDDSFLNDNWKQIFAESGEFSAIHEALNQWSAKSEKPVVLFIDEVDSLIGDTLISLLRQLRTGYTERPEGFPQNIILCGVRDVRDYRIHSKLENEIITGGSAFNIKTKSLRLGNFNLDEIKKLYKQHTNETGQIFHNDVFPLIWELTEGQPWLVNALGYETCFEMKEGRNREEVISVDMVNQAKENLIIRRETHLDQLVEKLSEERVRRVLEPILNGSQAELIPTDDVDYVIDFGMIKNEKQLRIANRIYQRIISGELRKNISRELL